MPTEITLPFPGVPISDNVRPCLAEVGKSVSITVLERRETGTRDVARQEGIRVGRVECVNAVLTVIVARDAILTEMLTTPHPEHLVVRTRIG